MKEVLGGILIFVVGFLVGATAMLSAWEQGAKRGGFEIGHVLYRAEPIK